MVQGAPAVVILVGLFAVLAASLALLALQRPPVTGATVLGAAPWMVAAALFHTLARLGAYPDPVAGLLTFPWVYLVVAAIASVVWAPLLQIGTLRDRDLGEKYLAAAGVGLVLALTTALLLQVRLTPVALLWLTATPFVAGVIAAGVYVLFGFLDPTTLATTGWAGYLVVFAFTLAGMAVVVTADVYGIRLAGSVGRELLDVVRALPVPASFGVGWLAALVATTTGAGAAALCARYVRASRVRGFAAMCVVVAAALGPGLARLLLTLFG